jgi:hypothetical protein
MRFFSKMYKQCMCGLCWYMLMTLRKFGILFFFTLTPFHMMNEESINEEKNREFLGCMNTYFACSRELSDECATDENYSWNFQLNTFNAIEYKNFTFVKVFSHPSNSLSRVLFSPLKSYKSLQLINAC